MAKLQARITDELDVRLNEAAAKAGWTKSAFVRYLLETSMGDDARMSALNQVIWGINSKLQRKLNLVGDALREALEDILLGPDEEDE